MSLVHRELVAVAQHVEQRTTIRCKVAKECLAHVGLSVVSGKIGGCRAHIELHPPHPLVEVVNLVRAAPNDSLLQLLNTC